MMTSTSAGGVESVGNRDLISPAEFAKRCSMSPVTVYRWIKNNRIPFVRLGRLVRIDAEAAIQHMNKMSRKGLTE